MGDIKGFFAGARRRGEARVEAPEGSLAEAEAEGRKLKAREERRAAYLAKAPTVQQVGAGPEADTRPKCVLCWDRRWLSEVLHRTKDGQEGRLCRSCVKQVEWDRERRCGSCGSPTRDWCRSGVCKDCHDKGVERVRNIEELRRRGWVLTTKDIVP